MAADRPAYFFTNGFVATDLARILEFSAKTNVRPARAKGFKLYNMSGRHVIIDGGPSDYVSGVAHQMCEQYDVRYARTSESNMVSGLIIATVTIQFIDDMTEALALMSQWAPNASQNPQDDRNLESEANIWHLRDPIPGYSSAMADLRFGQIEPPDLQREPTPPIAPIAPNKATYSPAISQALTIGHEKPQVLFPRPFLLYGSLGDPAEVANLLGLDSLPSFRKGFVKGYKRILCGSEPAVVFGSNEEIVHGVIYVVQSSKDAEKLRPGKDYCAFHCGIRLDEAPANGHPNEICQNGAIFRWVGDQSKLKQVA